MFCESGEGLRSKHRLRTGPTPRSTGCGGGDGKGAGLGEAPAPGTPPTQAKGEGNKGEACQGQLRGTRSGGLEECRPLGKPCHFQVSHWSELSSSSCRVLATPSLGTPKRFCSSLTCLPCPHTSPGKATPPRPVQRALKALAGGGSKEGRLLVSQPFLWPLLLCPPAPTC